MQRGLVRLMHSQLAGAFGKLRHQSTGLELVIGSIDDQEITRLLNLLQGKDLRIAEHEATISQLAADMSQRDQLFSLASQALIQKFETLAQLLQNHALMRSQLEETVSKSAKLAEMVANHAGIGAQLAQADTESLVDMQASNAAMKSQLENTIGESSKLADMLADNTLMQLEEPSASIEYPLMAHKLEEMVPGNRMPALAAASPELLHAQLQGQLKGHDKYPLMCAKLSDLLGHNALIRSRGESRSESMADMLASNAMVRTQLQDTVSQSAKFEDMLANQALVRAQLEDTVAESAKLANMLASNALVSQHWSQLANPLNDSTHQNQSHTDSEPMLLLQDMPHVSRPTNGPHLLDSNRSVPLDHGDTSVDHKAALVREHLDDTINEATQQVIKGGLALASVVVPPVSLPSVNTKAK